MMLKYENVLIDAIIDDLLVENVYLFGRSH